MKRHKFLAMAVAIAMLLAGIVMVACEKEEQGMGMGKLKGEETEDSYETLPSFMFNGLTYKVAPDPQPTSTEFISWETASIYCENLTLYGYSDWRMPTIEELETMYLNRNSIGGFVGDLTHYHSSTKYEYNSNKDTTHIFIDWYNGTRCYDRDLNIKGYTYSNSRGRIYAHVRPIRIDQEKEEIIE